MPSLVLSRKIGEAIIIRNDIRVTVVEVRGTKARLRIEAPADVTINRAEVQAAIESQEAERPEPGIRAPDLDSVD